jgi:hypothetical protein
MARSIPSAGSMGRDPEANQWIGPMTPNTGLASVPLG